MDLYADVMNDDDAEEFIASSNTLIITAAATVATQAVLEEETREPSIIQQRMDWCAFEEEFRQQKQYTQHMRMPPEDFKLLLSMVEESLRVDERQSLRRGKAPIIPEIKLYCAIRWMAGGSYSDIRIFAKISKASFFRVVWEAIDAINDATELSLSFPQTEEECFQSAEEFRRCSFGDAITNCVSVNCYQ